MDLKQDSPCASSFPTPSNKIRFPQFSLLLAFLFAFLVPLCSVFQPKVWAQDALAEPAPTIVRPVTLWADGITQVNELDAYKQAGFNTVIIRLTWQPSQNGELETGNLDSVKKFAGEAARRNLRVIYSLPAIPQGFERSMRISVDSQAYSTLWSAWVEGVINSLNNTPNLQGWMLPDDPRSLPIYDDLGFQKWISQNFATVAVLNRQWGANYQQIDDVTINDVAALAARFRNPLPVAGGYDNAQPETGLAFHPATLALAAYKWDTYRALLTMWVGAVRGADNNRHLVFSGQLPDYAQLLSQPDGIDVIMPSIVPGVAENDIVTHNPQGIDMARRGGKFSALPVFSAQESSILPKEALPDLVGRWMETACTRGAMGIGFDSWKSIKEDIALLTAVTERLKKLSTPPYAVLWNDNPVATTAILVTPLADGATVRFNNSGNEQMRGLYGFGDDLVLGEPSNLAWAMRWGSAFGGVDYLSPDDLDGSLDRYATIFAPQLLSCPLDVSARLGSYVFGGGTLVSDLGVGALQNGGQVNGMPQQMAQLFGVPGAYEIRQTTFNLSGYGQSELLPSWSRKIGIRNGLSLTIGDGPATSAFGGPVGYSGMEPTADVIAAGPPLSPNQRVSLRSEMTVQRSGRGYAVFAPFRLWQFWRPGYSGFDDFHGDLIARGAALAMRTNAFVPQPTNQQEGQTLFPEIINRAKYVVFMNHDAPGQPLKFASAETTGVGDWLWNGAITLFLSKSDAVLSAGRPAPIIAPDDFEARPRPIVLFSQVQTGESSVLEMIPVAVQNLQGGPIAAAMGKVQPAYMEINVWPNSPDVLPTQVNWQPMPGAASPFRVTIYNSENYIVKPNSKHRAVAIEFTKPSKKGNYPSVEKIVTADANGKLVVEFNGSAIQVKVTPAPVK